MRRSRRSGHAGLEFGGSGEDSFVAVVVTKLTGALLFILLLTMVIMALLPKVVDLPAAGRSSASEEKDGALTIATPGALPEAIAGRPYAVALAATGAKGPLRWAVDGELPEGLGFDAASGLLRGTPKAGTPSPRSLVLRVSDGSDRATRVAQLVVYQPDRPLTTPSRWLPGLPPIPWRAWLGQGFGFLVLLLVHTVGMNALGSLQRWSARSVEPDSVEKARALRRRFFAYRTLTRLATLGASAALAAWLWRTRA
jgi:hypothetical protein